MSETLTEGEFQRAVAASVRGVLNVYREADALLREFAAAMEGTEPHFVIAAKRLVPGVSRKSPDARFLRSYIATVLAPPNIDGEGEDDTVEEEDEDDDEADEQPIRKAIIVPTGGSLVVARVAIYDPDHADGFAPNLRITLLGDCRAVASGIADNAQFRIKRGLFRRIVRAADGATIGVVQSKGTATIEGPKKVRTGLRFAVATAPIERSLFSLAPDDVPQLAVQVASDWRRLQS